MKINFPRHLQQKFEKAIINKEYKPEQVFKNLELARQLDCSVTDMQMVLLAAHRKGLVEKQDKNHFKILGLAGAGLDSVFMHTQRSGLKPTSLVRYVQTEPAAPEVARELAIEAGAPVYRFVRTRNVNQEVLANQTNFIPFEVAPELDQDDVSTYSFQKLLEEKYLAVTADVEECFEIVGATEEDLEILDLPRSSSILLVQRLSLSPTGLPLVWANVRIRPDRYQYVAQLWPAAATLLAEGDKP